MRVIRLAIVAALLAASSPAAARPFQFPLKVDGHHLIDAEGRAFVYLGEIATGLFTLDRAAAVAYLRDRRIRGFTVIQAPLGGRDPREGGDAVERVDEIVRSAEALALVLALEPACAAPPDRCRDLGQWLGRRYARHGNIVWVAGETPSARALARGIRETAPRQPIDLGILAPTSRPFEAAVEARARRRPFLLAADLSAGPLRRAALATVLGGGIGYVGRSPVASFEPGWQGQLGAGAPFLLLRPLLESRPWQRLEPDPRRELAPPLPGEPPADPPAAARTADGSLALIYVPSPRPLRLDLRSMARGRVAASWWDPRTGEARRAGLLTAPGTFTLPPASRGPDEDWVLVLDAGDHPPRPPGAPN